MSTESTSPATEAVPADKEQVRSNERPTSEANLLSTPKWSWQDVLYLSMLVLLVAAMAYRYTPNLTGEVAGEWWDPLLNMWTLSWDTTVLLHAPTHLWQGQLLYPNPLTLSYSENLLGEVIFFAPFFLITHNPVLAYNMTFYLTFLLCGVSMYITARYYTGKSFAAFVAALIYAFAPYRLSQIDHIHIIAGEWIPLAFLYLDLSLQRNRWRHWSLFALFYLLQLLSSVYYGIFLSYSLLAYLLFHYSRPFVKRLRQQGREYLKHLRTRAVKPVVVFAVMLTILGLLMAPYLLSLHNGLGRSIGQTAGYSAFVRDFGFTSPFNWLYGINSYGGVLLPFDNEHYLFLGLTTMALTVLGIVMAFRRRDFIMRSYSWTALIVLLFAFGPFFQFSTPSGAPHLAAQPYLAPFPPAWPMPWLLAYYVLPGFNGLRVPARLIGILLMMLALLAAYGIAWLQEIYRNRMAPERVLIPTKLLSILSKERHDPGQSHTIPQMASSSHTGNPLRRRGNRKGTLSGGQVCPYPGTAYLYSGWVGATVRVALILIPFALLLEAVPAYLPVTQVPTGNQIPAVYQWLATHEGQSPIVELPIADADRNFIPKYEAWYDYYAIYHMHPIMNGWSGLQPTLTSEIAAALSDFPAPDSLTVLRQYHIQYVVLHLQYYRSNSVAPLLKRVEESPGLRRMAVFGSDSVWQVV